MGTDTVLEELERCMKQASQDYDDLRRDDWIKIAELIVHRFYSSHIEVMRRLVTN